MPRHDIIRAWEDGYRAARTDIMKELNRTEEQMPRMPFSRPPAERPANVLSFVEYTGRRNVPRARSPLTISARPLAGGGPVSFRHTSAKYPVRSVSPPGCHTRPVTVMYLPAEYASTPPRRQPRASGARPHTCRPVPDGDTSTYASGCAATNSAAHGANALPSRQ